MNKPIESTQAIERLYITMRYLFYKDAVKPTGVVGNTLREQLLKLEPEIYGSIADSKKVELNGLKYVLDRLPAGIEECSFIHLTSNEGFDKTNFQAIVPKKRRRNCYRIDAQQMNIEVLLGRSEIYDILTHLTFLFMEADKIRDNAYAGKNIPKREWLSLEECINTKSALSKSTLDVILVHLASIIGRTYDETLDAYLKFQEPQDANRFLKIIYFLGKVSYDDKCENKQREISFSNLLRERIGQHIYGNLWANNIKNKIAKHDLQIKKTHIISSNMHSVLNSFFAFDALGIRYSKENEMKVYEDISNDSELRKKIFKYALNNGMIYLEDNSGSNIDVQLFDLSKINLENTSFKNEKKSNDLILVFDYAFGEQAFEVLDELLKPFENGKLTLDIDSISIMGKAGILQGKKGDIMIPTSHIYEGTADNYPFNNDLSVEDFEDSDIDIYQGSMITVLGTSLQNKEILSYFMNTTWKAIGLEMEGAHYQKAIQIASKIRNHISSNVKVRYAYYASDNPLKTGSTLASGGLGLTGVKPTYTITEKIIEKIIEF